MSFWPRSGWPSWVRGLLTSQSRTVVSKLPLASSVPGSAGLKATLVTAPVWPESSLPSCLCASTSHSRTVLSQLPLASVRPSRLNATLVTLFLCPLSGSPSCFRVATSHSRTVLSPPAVARVFPSGLKATCQTSPAPKERLDSEVGLRAFHSVTPEASKEPEASVRPSGLKATLWTSPL